MRELTATEIFGVGGAEGLNFTSPINAATLNNVAKASTVGRMVTASFALGYAIGTYLNERYSISTRIVDLLT